MFAAVALYKVYGEGSKWPAVVAILGMVAQVFWYGSQSSQSKKEFGAAICLDSQPPKP